MGLRRRINTHLVQNSHLVWLDQHIDETNEERKNKNSIVKLQQVALPNLNELDQSFMHTEMLLLRKIGLQRC